MTAALRDLSAAPAPVLVFGSDTSAFLGAVRSLGRAGIEVHAAGCSRENPAGRSRYIAACHDLPPYEGDGSGWAARVDELLAHHGFSLLVPTSDSSLAQIAAHRSRFGAAARALPSDSALATLCDKAATRALAETLGIPVPPGALVTAPFDAPALETEFGLPLIVKPPRSYRPGNRLQKARVMLCHTGAQLRAALSGDAPLLVERFVPGYCRGLSVLAQDGEILQAVQHVRLRQNHSTGPSSWRRSEALDPRLLDAMTKLIGATRYSGIAMGEFRFAADGADWCLLEVNPRIWGSIQVAIASGADFPAAQHALLVEGRQPLRTLGFAPGCASFSALGEYEALAGLWDDGAPVYRRAGAMIAFLARLMRGRGFDSYAADDPAPFHAVRRTILRRLAGRLRKAIAA